MSSRRLKDADIHDEHTQSDLLIEMTLVPHLYLTIACAQANIGSKPGSDRLPEVRILVERKNQSLQNQLHPRTTH